VMKALLDLEESYKELRSASYRKALRISDNIYILLDGLKAVSRGLDRALVNKLSHLGVKKVHLVSGASDPRSLISSLLEASISSLNLYYAPDGSVYYVAKVLAPISARNADREEVVKRVFKLVTGNDIVIEYEEGLTEVSQVKGPKLEKEKPTASLAVVSLLRSPLTSAGSVRSLRDPQTMPDQEKAMAARTPAM